LLIGEVWISTENLSLSLELQKGKVKRKLFLWQLQNNSTQFAGMEFDRI
jgi:hypothetical protein